MSRGSCALLAFLALQGLLSAATAGEREVRRIAIRGRHTAADGTVQLHVSFRTGRDEALDAIDRKRLRVEIDRQTVSGGVTVRPLQGSGEEVAVLLAIDVSGTMRSVMNAVRAGLRDLDPLLRRVNARVAVGNIGDGWSLRLDFTKEIDRVRRVVGELRAKTATTALFESIHLGIGQLHQRGADLPARRLMVVVSDAYNEKKGRTADECVALARGALVQVHSLIFPTRRTAAYLSRKGELEKISRDSGGTTVTVASAQEIQRGLSAIADDLAKEMVVTVSGEWLRNDGRKHSLTLSYDRVSSSVSYRAPAAVAADAAAIGSAAIGSAATAADARAGPVARAPAPVPPTASVGSSGASGPGGGVAVRGSAWRLPLIAAIGGGGLLLVVLLVVVLLVVRSRRSRVGTGPSDGAAEMPAATLPGLEVAPPPPAAASASEAEPRPRPPPSSELQPVQQNIVIGADASQQIGGDPYSRPTLRVGVDGDGRSSRSAPGQVSCLRDVYGLVSQEPFRLAQGGARLGSDLSNEIVLESPSVSPHHAVIVPHALTHGFAVRDLGSAHGTFVDDVRVGADPVPIRPGCRIKLGLVTLACE